MGNCSVFRVPCIINFASNINSPQPPPSPSFILRSPLVLFLKIYIATAVCEEETRATRSAHWRAPCGQARLGTEA